MRKLVVARNLVIVILSTVGAHTLVHKLSPNVEVLEKITISFAFLAGVSIILLLVAGTIVKYFKETLANKLITIAFAVFAGSLGALAIVFFVAALLAV